jgi:regulator of RNase E activity RraA
VTVVVPLGAFNLVRFAMNQTRPGDVLVINARGITTFSMFGGNVAKAMRHRGVAGVIVDGAARDPEEAQAAGFPVFARATTTAAPPYEGTGEVNVPVACGGVVVRPGDIIVADQNGIVAVPPEGAEWVLEQAAALRARFDAIQPVLERGEVANIAAVTEALLKQGLVVDDDGGRG